MNSLATIIRLAWSQVQTGGGTQAGKSRHWELSKRSGGVIFGVILEAGKGEFPASGVVPRRVIVNNCILKI